jgi:hypothetical protein
MFDVLLAWRHRAGYHDLGEESCKERPMRTVLCFLPALALFSLAADAPPGPAPQSPAGIKVGKGQPALYAATYDIRDLVERPESWRASGSGWGGFRANSRLREGDPAQQVAPVVRAVLAALGGPGGKPAADREDFQILNGNRLVIRTDAARHALVAQALQGLRRLADVRVLVRANLYEVDHATYTRVAGARRPSPEELEELERRFLAGAAPKAEGPWQRLDRQKPLQAGEEVRIDNGREAAVLSRHFAVRCLPSPDQLRKGDRDPQAALEGVSFLAGVRVSPDRRFVWLKLTEKATDLKGLARVRVPDPAGNDVAAEVPVLDEDVHSRGVIIPDGGSELVPVQYRPASARQKGRWWVLSLTPRIHIEEEERALRRGPP